jgi:phosphate transport system substrate-binding protein
MLAMVCSSFVFGADQITIAGSTTVKPIVENAVQEYKKKNPGVEFVVGGGGSGQGIQLVSKASVKIGMSSRPLTADEKQTGGLTEYIIGMDGVALVSNTANPVAKLTKEQVQAIFTGQVKSWKELGGAAAPIVLFSLNSKHGTHEVFMAYFGLEAKETGEGAAMMAVHRKKGQDAYSTVTAKSLDDARQMVAAVVTNPYALGYVSVGIAAGTAAKGAPIRLQQLDGVAATEANVKSGVYLLSRPLLLLTKGDAQGKVDEFIKYMAGPGGQSIVKQMEYIPAAQ